MARLFGTDGVRGVANKELTCQMAFQLGQAAVVFKGRTILIGKDTRLSGDMLESAVAAGIMSMGGTALLAGIIPTPAIALLTRELHCDGGIVISASHNPPEYNGIKIFDGQGFKLPDSVEDEIEAFMARGGAFKELDVALAWHGGSMNGVNLGTSNGLNSAIFHFHGVTAHAGGDPHNGRSALDAVELMNVGANYLREHVTSDVRIHYVIKEGGTAPNIVPDNASVWYYVRAMSRQAIEDTYARLVKVAEGAAHMTETKLEIEFLGGCYNSMSNKVLVEVAHDMMEQIPLPQWTAEELDFAQKLNLESPQYEKMKEAGLLDGPAICSVVPPIANRNGYGSSDVGDVQHIVPCIMVSTATCNRAAPGHSWQITACAGMSIGHKGMLYGAKVLAATASKLVDDPTLVEKAKEEWNERMHGDTYHCPIPEEIPIPQPQK